MQYPIAKVRDNGRVRLCFELLPDTADLLRRVSRRECRSLIAQLTFMVEERARLLDIPREVTEQGGKGDSGVPSVPPSLE